MNNIYNPIAFAYQIEALTLTLVGSFVTMKFLNVIFENLYQPIMDSVIESKSTDKYYFKIGSYYIQADIIIKEFIKWIVIIILLMVVHNIYTANI